MEIKWHGDNHFTIKGREAVVQIDPNDTKNSGSVVITSQGDYSGEADFVFDWPGEYEARNVIIHTIPVGVGDDEVRVISLEIDGIRVGNLGKLSEDLDEKVVEELGDIDILMVPMTLKPKVAQSLIEEVDPRMVILSRFGSDDLPPIAPFLKEVGQSGLESSDKVVIKKKDDLDSESIVHAYMSS